VDRFVADDVAQIQQQVSELLKQGLPEQPRSQQADLFLQRLARLDAEPQIDAATVRDLYQGERS
jgi:malonate decarboxylase beta subunit